MALALLSTIVSAWLTAGTIVAQVTETDQPLVQILIYGLGAVHVTSDAQGDVLLVYLPEQGTPPVHNVAFWYGVCDGVCDGSGGHKWQQSSHNLGRHTVTFPDLTGSLVIHRTGSASGKPSTPAEAAGVQWMAKYRELDEGAQNIVATAANVHLELRAGQLETCALVHDPGTKFRICDLQLEGANGQPLRRAFSEYMVLRHPLSVGTTEITVLATPAGGQTLKQVVKVLEGTSSFVDWDDGSGMKRYRKFFDVLLANLPTSTRREMESDHGNLLKGSGKLFPSAVRKWSVTAPECRETVGGWICDVDGGCLENKQPACWGYFKTYPNFPSGLDRPICPLVEFP